MPTIFSIELMLLALSLSLYYVIHSLMASSWIKSIVRGYPIIYNTYRLWYSILSVVLLSIPLYVYFTDSHFLYFETGVFGRLFFLTAVVAAYRLATLSFRRIRLSEFLGLRPDAGSQLIVNGIYSYVRHPLYIAVLLLLVGLFIAIPSDKNLILLIITGLYVLIGASLEEGRLLEEFGEQYSTYKAQTPMLFPREIKPFLRYIIRNH